MGKDKIADRIKDEIIRGKYSAGQKLVEISLCTDLNLKRNRLREAFKLLEGEGFITIVPYKGAFVNELTQKDIAQIYDILGALEGLSMRVATPTITVEEIKKIQTLEKKIVRNRNNKIKVYEYNVEFHKYLTKLGKNTRLISFTDNLRQQAYRMSLENFYVPGQISSSLNDHKDIINAIKERDPLKVEDLIRNHYMRSKDRLIKKLNNSI